MQRWTVHLEGGPRRVNHAAVAIDERVYSFGGYCTGEDYETTRPMDVHILNTVSYRWRVLPVAEERDPQYAETPYQRYGHTVVAVREYAYVWGGRNDVDGACSTLFRFDTSTHLWCRVPVRGCIPGARDGHSACVINNHMYIFGGYEEEVEKFSNEVHALDFSTMVWTRIETLGSRPKWRDFHSAIGIGHKMYIFGGRSDRGGPYHTNTEIYCRKIQILDTLTATWSQPATHLAPIGRRSHSAFEHRGFLYIFGGYNGCQDIHFGDLHRFDPATLRWTSIQVKGQGPCARRRQCCCIINDRVFLFGGTSPCLGAYENTELGLDLMDHSDLYVLDLEPSLKMLCQLAVLEHELDTSCLPTNIRWDMAAMTTNSNISRPLNSYG